jgi:polysaccharide biosynthesis protein PslG
VWRRAGLTLLALAVGGWAPPAAMGISHASPSFFGVLAGGPLSTIHQRPALLKRELDRMGEAGAGSVRVSVWWNAMQRHRKDPVNWRPLDRIVAGAADRGIAVLPVILSAPCWAAVKPCLGRNFRPRDMKAFGHFLRQLVLRYGPRGALWRRHRRALPIRRWQIWNEPQFPGFWRGPNWPLTYTRALAVAGRSLKKADPGARVVLAGLSNFSWRELTLLYRAGARPYFDIVAMQTFTGKPLNLLAVANRIRKVMAAHGDGAKPLLLTEVSWAAVPRRSGLALPTIQVDRTTQARNLETLYALAEAARYALRIQGVFWSTWLSEYRSRVAVFDYSGLRRYDRRGDRVTSMPALAAFRRVARAGD